MKLGIISDIHGDYDALVRALERLEQHHHVDRIVCAGDLVGRGPEQDRVVEVIRKRGIPSVLGNHDEWYNDLTDANTAFLKNLPVDWRGTYAGHKIFMCHGKPGNNLWGMYRDHISGTYLNMVLSSLKVDVLITGHTHVPLFMQVERGCVVNPGSLFTFESQRGTSATYGVLSLPDVSFEVFDVRSETIKPVELEEYI